MSGVVMHIYTARMAGVAMQSLDSAFLIAGQGLEGDRYFTGNGTFSEKLKNNPSAELTLIEMEEIDRFNQENDLQLGYGDFRRNIVTQGVRLNELVDVTFSIGEVVLKGIRLCEPCAHLARIASERVLPKLIGRGGLRAQILTSAMVAIGDPVTYPSPH